MSGSIEQEMASLGARDITLSVNQKDDPFANADFFEMDSEDQDKLFESYEYRDPGPEDLLNDKVLEEYRKTFADQLKSVVIREELGSITATNGRHKAEGQLWAFPRIRRRWPSWRCWPGGSSTSGTAPTAGPWPWSATGL